MNKLNSAVVGFAGGSKMALGFRRECRLYPLEQRESGSTPLLNQQLADCQRFLRILFGVTDLANTVADPEKFIENSLDLICRELDRELAAAWRFDEETEELYCTTVHTCDKAAFEEFISVTRQTRFKVGQGLPGRALSEQCAVWIPNLARDSNYPRAPVAAKVGVKSGFAFGVKAGERPLAVLEFYSRYNETVDQEALGFFDKLAAHMALAIERKITEAKLSFSQSEVAARQQKLNAIIDGMAEAVFIIGADGRMAFTNAAGFELLGDEDSETAVDLREFPRAFLPDASTPFPKDRSPVRLALANQATTDVEMYIGKPRGGGGNWVSMTARAMYDDNGTISGAVLVARDITARKRLQEQLQQMADEAMASAKLKTEFVANVSHEIRTPLAGILGMAELLATREESDQESREIAGFVLQSAQSLLEIVNDLLDFSKLEAGKLTLSKEKLSVSGILEEVSRSISVSAAKKKLQLTVDCDRTIPEPLIGDKGRIVQVLLNFAHNAVKFTERGTISITAQMVTATPDYARVRLSVRDTGIGIKESIKTALFEPFVQGDGSTTRRYGGTGLGLSIAKKLTSLMGGEIGFESEVEKGSEFWIILPLQREPIV